MILAVSLFQLFYLGGGKHVLFFFDVFRKLHKPGKVGGANLLPHGPCGHLGNELLVLVDGGVAFAHVLVDHSLKIGGAQTAEFLIVQRLKDHISAFVSLNALFTNLTVMLRFPLCKDFRERHVVPLIQVLAGKLFQGRKSVRFLLVVSDDDLVFRGHPRPCTAA